MEKILIIKLSALGDVLRTTPILRVLNGEITWVTKKEAFPLLETPLINKLIDIDNEYQLENLKKEKFDLVLSLDEDLRAAKISSEIRTKKLIGVYLEDGRQVYTNDSRKWFDMSLISRYGLKKANELKKINKLSYQEHLFSMLGKKFKGEEYVLDIEPLRISKFEFPNSKIGIEKRAGEKWQAKKWLYYDELVKKLKKDGYIVKVLRQRKNLTDYIEDINNCSIIVCGDTLAMHIGLGLQKKVVALFTCTSPQEIYDYGRMIKIVSPKLDKYFYQRKFIPEASGAISLNEVYEAIKSVYLI